VRFIEPLAPFYRVRELLSAAGINTNLMEDVTKLVDDVLQLYQLY
jgi:hypothetical protein